MAQATQIYNLTFNREQFHTPILWSLGKRFRLTVNIRRAMLSEDSGWAEVSLAGPEEEIGRAVADLQTTGVSVTGPVAAPVEPTGPAVAVLPIGRGT